MTEDGLMPNLTLFHSYIQKGRADANRRAEDMQTKVVELLGKAGIVNEAYPDDRWFKLGDGVWTYIFDSVTALHPQLEPVLEQYCGMNPNGYPKDTKNLKITIPQRDKNRCCDNNTLAAPKWLRSRHDYQPQPPKTGPKCPRKSCDPALQCCLRPDGSHKDYPPKSLKNRRELLSRPIFAGRMQDRAEPDDCRKNWGDEEDRTTVNEAEAANAVVDKLHASNPARVAGFQDLAKGGDPYAISELKKALTAGSVPAAAALAAAALATPAAAAALSAAAAAPAAAAAVAAVAVAPEAAAATAAVTALSTAAATSVPAYQALSKAAATNEAAKAALSKLPSPPAQSSGSDSGDDGSGIFPVPLGKTSSSASPPASSSAPAGAPPPIASSSSATPTPQPTRPSSSSEQQTTSTRGKPPR
ncbi:hypothetical protein IE81DRAFT_346556 [Ceraceosorus guamensis]|uniref:Uncharacterized protein n=1 Tax=Ceraceosorus guamensis TaxID=1522189 RepID=A0A316W2M7_9BASI|nr:hypothetical protein IE81DRAFT_346556 [Ceraceosorus guamensis]PWN43348.1 hypothetical protein IE81DRAFT_346556 [Ceraceosorus guamensis]